jgi:hypothetical protein
MRSRARGSANLRVRVSVRCCARRNADGRRGGERRTGRQGEQNGAPRSGWTVGRDGALGPKCEKSTCRARRPRAQVGVVREGGLREGGLREGGLREGHGMAHLAVRGLWKARTRDEARIGKRVFRMCHPGDGDAHTNL